MITDFERYHGIVLREIVVKSRRPVTLCAADEVGRINTFVVDERAILHIKHSSKRLPPWQFTFAPDNIAEIEGIEKTGLPIWFALVCGQDGLVALTLAEFRYMNPMETSSTSFVRVDRDRNKMYRLNGTGEKLKAAKPQGMSQLVGFLEIDKGPAS